MSPIEGAAARAASGLDLERRHLAAQANAGQLVVVEPSPAREAQRLDHELHAIALLVLVVAVLVEHAQHRIRDAEQL
jgi:hypothetical protein